MALHARIRAALLAGMWLAAGSPRGPSRPARARSSTRSTGPPSRRPRPSRTSCRISRRDGPRWWTKTPKEDRAKMFGIMKAMDVHGRQGAEGIEDGDGLRPGGRRQGRDGPRGREGHDQHRAGGRQAEARHGRAGSSSRAGGAAGDGPGRRSLSRVRASRLGDGGSSCSSAKSMAMRRQSSWIPRKASTMSGSKWTPRPATMAWTTSSWGARPCRPARSTGRRRRRRARPSARRRGWPPLASLPGSRSRPTARGASRRSPSPASGGSRRARRPAPRCARSRRARRSGAATSPPARRPRAVRASGASGPRPRPCRCRGWAPAAR